MIKCSFLVHPYSEGLNIDDDDDNIALGPVLGDSQPDCTTL